MRSVGRLVPEVLVPRVHRRAVVDAIDLPTSRPDAYCLRSPAAAVPDAPSGLVRDRVEEPELGVPPTSSNVPSGVNATARGLVAIAHFPLLSDWWPGSMSNTEFAPSLPPAHAYAR